MAATKRNKLIPVVIVMMIALYYIIGDDTMRDDDYDYETGHRANELQNFHRQQHYLSLKEKIEYDHQSGHLRRKVPAFIIVGAEQCGVNIIERILRHHSAIHVPINSAFHYFDGPYGADPGQYISAAPQISWFQEVIDITLSYFNYQSSEISWRVANLLDTVTLLVVCDPIIRVANEYAYQEFSGLVPKSSFENAADTFLSTYGNVNDWLGKSDSKLPVIPKDNTDLNIFKDSVYFTRVRSWKRRFAQKKREDKLLVVNGDDIFKNPGEIIEQIQEFFNLPKLILRRDLTVQEDGTIFLNTPWLSEPVEVFFPSFLEQDYIQFLKENHELRKKLQNFYGPINQELYTITKDFGWS